MAGAQLSSRSREYVLDGDVYVVVASLTLPDPDPDAKSYRVSDRFRCLLLLGDRGLLPFTFVVGSQLDTHFGEYFRVLL